MALLAQSFRATIQQEMRGNGTAGNKGAHNRAGNANVGQGKPVKCYNCNGVGHIARNCTQPKHPQNSDYFKDKMLLMQAQENGAVLDEEELLFLAGEQGNTFDADVDNQPVQDLALNEDNIFQADECDAFDSDVDDEPTAQSIFMANLSSVGSANPQAGPSNASILSEVHTLENAIDHSVSNQDKHEIHNKVQPSDVIDTTSVHMGNSNVIPYEQYLSVNDISGVPSCASSAPNSVCVLPINDAFVPHDPIATELKIYKEQVAIYERCAMFELTEREQRMDDQMRMLIQNRNKMEENIKKELHSFKLQLKSTMENNKIIEETNTSLTRSIHTHCPYDDKSPLSRGKYEFDLKEKVSRLTKKNSDTDPTFDLKALVSQNKDLTAKLNALYDLNECFRAENAKVKQHYKELYDSIKITRAKTTDQNNSLLSEIEHLKDQLKENSKCVSIPDCKPKVPPSSQEESVERPLDTSLASACRYTKHSQELLEYVIGMCPKVFGPRDKQNVSTNSLRKKGVTFVEPCETSTHNTPPQVEHQKINSTNVPGIPSTGVKGASAASRSKPRSNTKKDRTMPAKSALKQVEAHSRMNKSNEKHKNRVDSSISYKRTVINSNSNTSCKTCNKCLISVNHDQCVVRSEMRVKQPSATKVWQWPLTRNTPPKVVPTKQWKPTGRLLPLGRHCPLVRLYRSFSGAIMGYGDYVISDSVISRVYYVEGLGHNFFFVGQFCDSDLEVAFRKHTCFIRDLDGVDLIKGSR
ncbi:retrovirus-related pol polyprotein from transposon TNT 1-94, partial [Tanacetum coccineum]